MVYNKNVLRLAYRKVVLDFVHSSFSVSYIKINNTSVYVVHAYLILRNNKPIML